jgi:two-component system, NtrC family, response regulator GlrR
VAEESIQTTRRLGIRDGAEIVVVRRAVVEVVRGPDKGRSLEVAEEPVVIGTDPEATLVLSDDTVSGRHAEIARQDGGFVLRDLDSTNGTRVGGVRVREAVLDRKSITLSFGETELRFRVLDDEFEERLILGDRYGDMVGVSTAMRRVFELCQRAAVSDSTVLLYGESGTGKELLAETLHRQSPRAGGPLVVVDCSTLTPTLAESELFGHVRGAFTGAVDDRGGALEEASGGTLFLDEIGDLPLPMQPVLLRALAAREVKPVGSDRYHSIDVRVVAATHRDLSRAVAGGTFRADLYYRLAVLRIAVPPLRHRREDIPHLAREIIRRLRPGTDPDQVLSASVVGALTSYSWPGNVRELRNAVERLLLMGEIGELESDGEHLDLYHQARRQAIDDFEKNYVRSRLAESGGVIAQAANRSGISRQMFHRLVKRHGLED